MIETVKYVRKPLYVDAIKVTEENIDEVCAWCHGNIQHSENLAEPYIFLRVHNPKTRRQSQAYVGDWILYTPRGYKIYTEKAFFNNFNLVETIEKPRLVTETEINEIVH